MSREIVIKLIVINYEFNLRSREISRNTAFSLA